MLRDEIDTGRPVIAKLSCINSDAHDILIFGYDTENHNRFRIYDPKNGMSYISYSHLVNGESNLPDLYRYKYLQTFCYIYK